MPADTSKPPSWSRRAAAAFANSLDHIAAADPLVAEMVVARVDRSIALIQAQPGIGTPTATPGVRRHAVPNTGHVIVYRFVKSELRILRWYRARQRPPLRS
jgi:plasmid stabilization system protein ParE